MLHGLKELRDEIDRLLGRVGSVTIVHEEWLLLCHLIREIVGELYDELGIVLFVCSFRLSLASCGIDRTVAGDFDHENRALETIANSSIHSSRCSVRADAVLIAF